MVGLISHPIFFNAYCLIERHEGVHPTTGAPYSKAIWEGKCSYQTGANNSSGIQGETWQIEPDLYIPTIIDLHVNDRVIVEVDNMCVDTKIESWTPNSWFGWTYIPLHNGTEYPKSERNIANQRKSESIQS